MACFGSKNNYLKRQEKQNIGDTPWKLIFFAHTQNFNLVFLWSGLKLFAFSITFHFNSASLSICFTVLWLISNWTPAFLELKRLFVLFRTTCFWIFCGTSDQSVRTPSRSSLRLSKRIFLHLIVVLWLQLNRFLICFWWSPYSSLWLIRTWDINFSSGLRVRTIFSFLVWWYIIVPLRKYSLFSCFTLNFNFPWCGMWPSIDHYLFFPPRPMWFHFSECSLASRLTAVYSLSEPIFDWSRRSFKTNQSQTRENLWK